jgi:hypothetical protein
VIPAPATARVWLVAGVTGGRLGFRASAAQATPAARAERPLGRGPIAGRPSVIRSRRADLIAIAWWAGQQARLFSARWRRAGSTARRRRGRDRANNRPAGDAAGGDGSGKAPAGPFSRREVGDRRDALDAAHGETKQSWKGRADFPSRPWLDMNLPCRVLPNLLEKA